MSRSNGKNLSDSVFRDGQIELAAEHFLEEPIGPVFTRVLMEEAAQQLRMIAPGGGYYELHDINNVKRKLYVRLIGGKDSNGNGPKLGIAYHSWLRVPEKLKGLALARKPILRPTQTHPLSFVTIQYEYVCSIETGGFERQLEKFEADWEASSFCAELKTFLRRNYEQLEKINRICCFGLGPLVHDSKNSEVWARPYTQHLAACTVRDVIFESCSNKVTNDRVKIFAQEPAYCKTCSTILCDRLGVEVVEDPDGFLLIDENTFVISIAPDAPVNQIIVDMTADSAGPAGLLCCTQTPESLSRMVEEFVPWTDPISPRVLEYVSGCLRLDFDQKCYDVEDHPLSRTSVYLKRNAKTLK